jgi:hypothetical protein
MFFWKAGAPPPLPTKNSVIKIRHRNASLQSSLQLRVSGAGVVELTLLSLFFGHSGISNSQGSTSQYKFEETVNDLISRLNLLEM